MSQGLSIVTFGELLLRLDVPDQKRLLQANQFDVSFTGGEANVAVNLSQWGHRTRIISKVPGHELGQACCNHFERYGADTSLILRGGERLGLFYVETAIPPRNSKVVYDRLNTSFRQLSPEDLDWERILDSAQWFHFTGTAPAAGENVCRCLLAGLSMARQRGIPVSFDCSYRATLWSEEEAASVMPQFLEHSDVFFGSDHDANTFFGITATGEQGMRELQRRYQLRTVAYTYRRIHPSGTHAYSASVLHQNAFEESEDFEFAVVDRIGAGDAFAAGWIHSQLKEWSTSECLNFAAASAALKHSIPGDFALVSETEVSLLASGTSVGRVQR